MVIPPESAAVAIYSGVSFLTSKTATIIPPKRLLRRRFGGFSSGAPPTVCNPRQHSPELPQISALWLAEMPSAESGATLSRPSVNFEPAFDQELLSIVRTCP